MVFRSAEKLYLYSIKLGICPPSQEIGKIPSLLGRDIIDQWRIVYDKPGGALEAEVVTATAEYELKTTQNKTILT